MHAGMLHFAVGSKSLLRFFAGADQHLRTRPAKICWTHQVCQGSSHAKATPPPSADSCYLRPANAKAKSSSHLLPQIRSAHDTTRLIPDFCWDNYTWSIQFQCNSIKLPLKLCLGGLRMASPHDAVHSETTCIKVLVKVRFSMIQH